MMSSFVISLLLLSLFLTKAQGIRLEKGSFAAQQHKQHDQEHNLLKINNNANEEAIICEVEQYCTGKIKIRKLVTSSNSTTHDISKNVNGGNEAQAPEICKSRNYKVSGHQEKEILVNKQQELSHEHYLDLLDMDYLSPKQIPPVHD